jgi:hypothetical protein
MASKRCDGAEEEWQMANVHRLHDLEQGMSEG